MPRELDPIERQKWPERLAAHLVQGGDEPRIAGYAVDDDLAVNYSFAESLLVALTGEAPSADVGRAFEIALTFAMALGAGDASAHGASLARLTGAVTKNVVAVAAIGAGERAAAWCEPATLAWLGTSEVPPPPSAVRVGDPRTRALRSALPASFSVPHLAHPLRIEAAVLAVLTACGLSAEGIVVALTLSGLGPAAAEALRTKPRDVMAYPTPLPPFEYREGDE